MNKVWMGHKKLSNDELEERLSELSQQERKTTAEILELIHLAESRKLYLERGFPSLFDWLTKTFHYSESAAYRRIQASRLLAAVPEAKEKLQEGHLTLSSLAKTQSLLRSEEQKTGMKLSNQQKSSLLSNIEGQSSAATEKILFESLPAAAQAKKQDYVQRTNATTIRLSVSLTNESMKDLERVRELLSHAVPEGEWSALIAYLTKDFLKRRDPLRKRSQNQPEYSVQMNTPSGSEDMCFAKNERDQKKEKLFQEDRPASEMSLKVNEIQKSFLRDSPRSKNSYSAQKKLQRQKKSHRS